jgi:hypothetical protein
MPLQATSYSASLRDLDACPAWAFLIGCLLAGLLLASPARAQDSLWRRDPPTREWEFEKHQRIERVRQAVIDSTMRVYHRRVVVSGGYNALFIPWLYAATPDVVTGVDLRQSPFFPGFTLEYFVYQNTRLGLDFSPHILPRNVSVSVNTRRVRGGGGAVMPVMFQVKQNLPIKLPTLLGSGPRAELYGLVGVGISLTTLVEINGRIDAGSQPDTDAFAQMRPISALGVGVFQRLGRVLVLDWGVRYQFAQSYSPAIASVSAYGGLRTDLRLGLMLGGGFAKAQRQARRP